MWLTQALFLAPSGPSGIDGRHLGHGTDLPEWTEYFLPKLEGPGSECCFSLWLDLCRTLQPGQLRLTNRELPQPSEHRLGALLSPKIKC